MLAGLAEVPPKEEVALKKKLLLAETNVKELTWRLKYDHPSSHFYQALYLDLLAPIFAQVAARLSGAAGLAKLRPWCSSLVRRESAAVPSRKRVLQR